MTKRFAALIATTGVLATAGASILPATARASARYPRLRWRSKASTAPQPLAARSLEQ